MNELEIRQQIHREAEALLEHRARGVAGVAAWLALAAGLLGLFYLVGRFFDPEGRLYQFFFLRGPFQHAIMAFAMLALADLAIKCLRFWLVERRGGEAVVLPGSDAVTPDDLLRVARRLGSLAQEWPPARGAVRTRRLALGLLQFTRGDSKEGIRAAMQAQADVDEAALTSRYTLVKLLLWAIPLLGFIGTVEGIGNGIGQFSADLAQETATAEPGAPPAPEGAAGAPPSVTSRMEAVKSSLQNVTGGLGRAFDTTYLALVATVLLMIFMAVLEKVESDHQLRVDESCQTHFVGRLPSSSSLGEADAHRLGDAAAELRQSAGEARQAAAVMQEVRDALQQGLHCRVTLDREGKK